MEQRLQLFQVDAFSDRVFGGNPAAVVPLKEWLDDRVMQDIASENQLSETAFFVPATGNEADYHLRWFTPSQEVSLCGHATLATAFVVFEAIEPGRGSVTFETQSGRLDVERTGGHLAMRLPAQPIEACDPPDDLLEGLSARPREVYVGQKSAPNYYAVYNAEDDVRGLKPRSHLLERLHPHGVAVTAPGETVDFVSRYFAPSYGIPEDPVTGSTHCALAPHWARVLQKNTLTAHQLSSRGGELVCEVEPDQVRISGQAVKYLEGDIFLHAEDLA